MFSKNIQSGQTLIEALIAMTVGVIVVISAAVLTQTSLISSRTSISQNVATQYAQEGLEIARISTTIAVGTYCLDQIDDTLGTADGGCSGVGNINNGEYMREVVIGAIVAGSSCGGTNPVSSKVSWTDGKCDSKFCRKVELRTCVAP